MSSEVQDRGGSGAPYRLSFTFGGLLIPESRAVAAEFVRSGDWAPTKANVLELNLLGKTRSSSVRRYVREIKARLEHAYDWELAVLAGTEGTAVADTDAPAVLFCIMTRYYRLVGDFTAQVVRRRLLDGLRTIDASMFRAFVSDQEPAHPELSRVADSTREKLTTVAIRSLREAGIVAESRPPYTLRRPATSTALGRLYCERGAPEDLIHLLWSDEEIRACIT